MLRETQHVVESPGEKEADSTHGPKCDCGCVPPIMSLHDQARERAKRRKEKAAAEAAAAAAAQQTSLVAMMCDDDDDENDEDDIMCGDATLCDGSNAPKDKSASNPGG